MRNLRKSIFFRLFWGPEKGVQKGLLLGFLEMQGSLFSFKVPIFIRSLTKIYNKHNKVSIFSYFLGFLRVHF